MMKQDLHYSSWHCTFETNETMKSRSNIRHTIVIKSISYDQEILMIQILTLSYYIAIKTFII